jgi:tRNA-specific 2-thiouridylase
VALADLAPSAAAAVAATSSAATAASASDDRENVSASSFVPTPDLLRHCEPPASNGGRVLKIAVLLSGGVDSSVALTLLKAAGHDVTAFYLQIWFQEDFRNYWDQCPWEDDLRVARGVCDALDVPLRVVPLTDAYWDLVVSKSIDEIAKGRTPNP